MTFLILPFASLLGWNQQWVVSSLMIFSIGRTTASGLNSIAPFCLLIAQNVFYIRYVRIPRLNIEVVSCDLMRGHHVLGSGLPAEATLTLSIKKSFMHHQRSSRSRLSKIALRLFNEKSLPFSVLRNWALSESPSLLFLHFEKFLVTYLFR